MELDQIDALRASVAMLRGTNDRMIDEIGVRTGARLEQPVSAPRAPRQAASSPLGPRHIDEVLEDDGEVAGAGFVIPADPPPSSTY